MRIKPLYILFAWLAAAVVGRAATDWIKRKVTK